MQIKIENMTCGGCARRVERAILSVDSEAKVFADPRNRVAEVNSFATRAQLEAALRTAGFKTVAV